MRVRILLALPDKMRTHVQFHTLCVEFVIKHLRCNNTWTTRRAEDGRCIAKQEYSIESTTSTTLAGASCLVLNMKATKRAHFKYHCCYFCCKSNGCAWGETGLKFRDRRKLDKEYDIIYAKDKP